MLNSKQMGDVAELKLALFFIESGFNVSKPLSEYSKYDLILDSGSRLIRIQVKHGQLRENGVISCTTKSVTIGTDKKWNVKKYAKQDFEYFAIYEPVNKLFFIVKNEGEQSQINLNYACEKSNSKTRFASDYTLEKFLESIKIVG